MTGVGIEKMPRVRNDSTRGWHWEWMKSGANRADHPRGRSRVIYFGNCEWYPLVSMPAALHFESYPAGRSKRQIVRCSFLSLTLCLPFSFPLSLAQYSPLSLDCCPRSPRISQIPTNRWNDNARFCFQMMLWYLECERLRIYNEFQYLFSLGEHLFAVADFWRLNFKV